MNQQKYIRVENLCGVYDVFVLFSPLISHVNLAFALGLSDGDIVSAGFVQNIVEDGKRQANCHGKSHTLKCTSLPEDTKMLARQHYSTGKNQKYLRFEALDDQTHPIILIPNSVMHSEFASLLQRAARGVVAAGFVANGLEGQEISPVCYGESESLGLKSIEEDTDLLIRQHYSFLLPDLW